MGVKLLKQGWSIKRNGIAMQNIPSQ